MSKARPIEDPTAHAAAVTGYEARELRRTEPWRDMAAFHTTEEFKKSPESTYHQHCGPTALVNVICTMGRRRGMTLPDAAEIFKTCAAIGRRRLTYWNVHEKFHMGGTSYLLLRPYVSACLRAFGMDDAVLTWRVQASPARMVRELEQGRLLVLAMTHHGCYGSHLVMAHGAVWVSVAGRGAPRVYLLLSDGWASRPRYVAADSLRLCGYVAVEQKG